MYWREEGRKLREDEKAKGIYVWPPKGPNYAKKKGWDSDLWTEHGDYWQEQMDKAREIRNKAADRKRGLYSHILDSHIAACQGELGSPTPMTPEEQTRKGKKARTQDPDEPLPDISDFTEVLGTQTLPSCICGESDCLCYMID
jgi:hypothetical protein